jgi:hypothetical protein
VGEGTGQLEAALKEGQRAAGDAVDQLAGGRGCSGRRHMSVYDSVGRG